MDIDGVDEIVTNDELKGQHMLVNVDGYVAKFGLGAGADHIEITFAQVLLDGRIVLQPDD